MTNNAFNSLAALMNAVFVETNRPDLLTETAQAVFASTLKMHGMDFFGKDIATGQLVFDSSSYIQTLDTNTLPYYRAIAVIRKDNPALYGSYELNPTNLPPLFTGIDGRLYSVFEARAILKEISIDNIFDEFKAEKVDVWYQAGSTIMIRSSTALKWGLISWYAWPNLDINNANLATFLTAPQNCSPLFNSWVAQEFPYAIIFDAASSVLQKQGQVDAARKYDQVPDPRTGRGAGLIWSHINNMLISNIVNTGR